MGRAQAGKDLRSMLQAEEIECTKVRDMSELEENQWAWHVAY